MWNSKPSATSATPISTRNASASILVVGCSATKRATGPDETYITMQAMITAAIMISRSFAMPIAVMMESSENTRSTTMICRMIQKNALCGPCAAASPPSRASTSP